MLERTSFLFVKGYMATGTSMDLDRPVVHGLIEGLIRKIPESFIRLMHNSMSVAKTAKTFPSFKRKCWFPLCLDTLHVRTRMRHTAIIEGH